MWWIHIMHSYSKTEYDQKIIPNQKIVEVSGNTSIHILLTEDSKVTLVVLHSLILFQSKIWTLKMSKIWYKYVAYLCVLLALPLWLEQAELDLDPSGDFDWCRFVPSDLAGERPPLCDTWAFATCSLEKEKQEVLCLVSLYQIPKI